MGRAYLTGVRHLLCWNDKAHILVMQDVQDGPLRYVLLRKMFWNLTLNPLQSPEESRTLSQVHVQ